MASPIIPVEIDYREICREYVTVRVQHKNYWWFKFGLLFIRLGCWMTGAQFVDEFPMSLIQPDEVERDAR